MLDQISSGRMQIGIGRGISPLETRGFGIDPGERIARYEDTCAVMMQGLTRKVVDFHGRFFRFDNVPMELEPYQKPHPPIWIGTASPDSAARAARHGHNIVSLSTSAETRAMTDNYRKAWIETHGDQPLPRLGLGRFIVVADTDAAALTLARRAYRKWHDSFHHLWRKHGTVPTHGERAREFDDIMDGGRGVAGTPATCIRMLQTQLAESGANYAVGQFVFGDMTLAEALGSIELFVREVMPAVRRSLA